METPPNAPARTTASRTTAERAAPVTPATRVGIIGGGQLAMMMAEAAPALGLRITALTPGADDPIFRLCPDAFVGDARNGEELRRLAAGADVLTFDHELVDPEVLAQLEDEGIEMRPGSRTMAYAIDKRRQSELFAELELFQPDTVVVTDVERAIEEVTRLGGSAVLKLSTGGYDGRGVLLGASDAQVRDWFPAGSATVLVQARMDIDDELAVQVVRAKDGSSVVYAPTRTMQVDGMCSSVSIPAEFDAAIEAEAMETAVRIADAIELVGILAVEFFLVGGRLMVNELAARPHNSGHLTIEACRTSQFENHLRAVAGLPLGATDRIVPAAAMVNLVGEIRSPGSVDTLPADVHVHLYGKAPRPGRKIGHVTAVAATRSGAVELATAAANELENGRGSS